MSTNKKFKCEIDGRLFASQAAFKQHQATHRANGSGPRPRMKAPARSVMSGNVMTGADIITLVEFTPSQRPGQVLYQIDVSPKKLLGTRLNAAARLWARWRPIRFRFSVVSGASTTVGGLYMMGWSGSVHEKFTTPSTANIQKLAAFKPNVESNLYTPRTLDVPCAGKVAQNWLLVDGEDEESAHGNFILMCSSPLSGTSHFSTVNLRLHLDWTVHFDSPDVTTPDDDLVYAEESYSHYFTDSVGDWKAGAALTLKAAEGGNVVPFPTAKPGVVYKLAGGAKLKFCKPGETSSTASGQITHATLMRDYYAPGFAVFPDEQTAINYAMGTDKTTKYTATGPYVHPNNPAWKGVGNYVPYPKPNAVSLELAVGDSNTNRRVASLEKQFKTLLKQQSQMLSILQGVGGTGVFGPHFRVFVDDPFPLGTTADDDSSESESIEIVPSS